MNDKITQLGQQFISSMTHVHTLSLQRAKALTEAEKVHVIGGGGTIVSAYEQLRNAAEYTEDHLLLQRAIRRYFKRVFLSQDRAHAENSGEELIIELTLAGYIANDSVAVSTIDAINQQARLYFAAHTELSTKNQTKDTWTLDVLSVRIEEMIQDQATDKVFAQLSFDHFLETVDMTSLSTGAHSSDNEAALFVAVQRALLHSGDATIRATLLDRYQQTPATMDSYIAVNRQIDILFDADITDKLLRIVSRRGAPLRVLRRMIQETESIETLLQNKSSFLSNFENQASKEYDSVTQRINRGIIKSVIFLVITKFIIGIAIEVPYDFAVHGEILWLPLIINLLFPPVYMILLRLTLATPGYANTTALVDRIEDLFFGEPKQYLARRRAGRFGAAFTVAYALLIIAVFALVSWWLITLGFSLVHLLIFFIFLSTASFLGFRLSRMVRDIEVVDADQNGVTFIRDILYMPFVFVGRWLSEKYAKVNLVATLLDMVIELPLKTVLRLVRQWSAFINSKKDEL